MSILQDARCCTAGPGCAHTIQKLWNDNVRHRQVSGFTALQLQVCDQPGKVAWEAAHLRWLQIPEAIRRNVYLPSVRLFSRILGLCRTGATLKKNPMTVLELSCAEIAQLVGYSKSQVAAALRWLAGAPIVYRMQVVAQGLGLILRSERKGLVRVCRKIRGVFRTSCIQLSEAGRGLIGLVRPAANVDHKPAPPPWTDEGKQARKREAKAQHRSVVQRLFNGYQRDIATSATALPCLDETKMTVLQRGFMEDARRIMAKFSGGGV